MAPRAKSVSCAAFLLLTLSIAGCGAASSSAVYQEPPPGSVQYGTGASPVDPDDYEVSPADYPSFHVRTDIDPPDSTRCWFRCSKLTQVRILPTDIWHVTHVVAGKWLIESSAYQDRQEAYVRSHYHIGSNKYNYAIYVDGNGVIDGGWQLLPGSNKLFSERYMYFTFDPKNNAGWSKGTVFEKVQN